MCDETTYPYPNLNGEAIVAWEWISNFVSHYTWGMVTYPCDY